MEATGVCVHYAAGPSAPASNHVPPSHAAPGHPGPSRAASGMIFSPPSHRSRARVWCMQHTPQGPSACSLPWSRADLGTASCTLHCCAALLQYTAGALHSVSRAHNLICATCAGHAASSAPAPSYASVSHAAPSVQPAAYSGHAGPHAAPGHPAAGHAGQHAGTQQGYASGQGQPQLKTVEQLVELLRTVLPHGPRNAHAFAEREMCRLDVSPDTPNFCSASQCCWALEMRTRERPAPAEDCGAAGGASARLLPPGPARRTPLLRGRCAAST